MFSLGYIQKFSWKVPILSSLETNSKKVSKKSDFSMTSMGIIFRKSEIRVSQIAKSKSKANLNLLAPTIKLSYADFTQIENGTPENTGYQYLECGN